MAPAEDETIAIAIPTRNRHSYLAVLLASLAAQTYTHWLLVINDDESDVPVETDDAIKDLLALIRARGHEVIVVRGKSGNERHQKAMEAVPASIEFIVRIDDDMLAAPTFIENLLKPFRFFPDETLAAVGGCYPGVHLKSLNLDMAITNPGWVPRFDEPSWRLQGYPYDTREVVEVESLHGCAICYRRSAVQGVGGWAVDGYSPQAHREESDLCARLFVNGYRMMVTTEAVAWHLYAPGGGSRTVKKTAEGIVLTSDPRPLDADEQLFRTRLARLKATASPRTRALGRFKIEDLENNLHVKRPLITLRSRLLRAVERSLLRPARRIVWYFASRPKQIV